MDASLKLGNEISVIGSASDFAWKWALNVGMEPDAAARLALAIDEIVTNVVLFAFGDERGEFEVQFRQDGSSAEVIVREFGIPFDPDRHRYDPQAALERGEFEGAGLLLVENLVDDFVFINRGRSGKEFRVSQRLKSADAEEMWLRFEHPDVPEAAPPTELPAPDTTYYYTIATPLDAEDIARLIFRTYRHTYGKEDVYFPKRIEATLESLERFGVMARTETGRAAGYFAVLRIGDSDIGEVAEAVVSPAHRRRGLMTRMLDELVRRSRIEGLRALFGEAVTVHTISQRVNEKLGFHTTALVLASFPVTTYRDLVEAYPQPISVAIDFLPLDIPRRREVTLPRPYREILLEIYERIGITVHENPALPLDPEIVTDVDTRIKYANRSAEVVVKTMGRDIGSVIAGLRDTLLHSGITSVYIDLPLAHPATGEAVDILGRNGFVFAGLMPLFHYNLDYLRLQHISIDLDLNLIATHSPTAGRIKEQIRNELKWTTGGKMTS